jgi:hypothetical protein
MAEDARPHQLVIFEYVSLNCRYGQSAFRLSLQARVQNRTDPSTARQKRGTFVGRSGRKRRRHE